MEKTDLKISIDMPEEMREKHVNTPSAEGPPEGKSTAQKTEIIFQKPKEWNKTLNYLQPCIQRHNCYFAQSILSNRINKYIHQETLLFCIYRSWFYLAFWKSLSLLFILIIYHFAKRMQAPRAQKKIRECSSPQGCFFSLILRDLIEFFCVYHYFIISYPHSI